VDESGNETLVFHFPSTLSPIAVESTFVKRLGRESLYMLSPTSRFKEYVKERYQDWARAIAVLEKSERRALRELFGAVLSTSDSACSSVMTFPDDMMFMLMLIHIESELDRIRDELAKYRNDPATQARF